MFHISVRNILTAVLTFLVALSLPAGNKAQAATKSVEECERSLGEAASNRKLVQDCLLASMGLPPSPDPRPEPEQRPAAPLRGASFSQCHADAGERAGAARVTFLNKCVGLDEATPKGRVAPADLAMDYALASCSIEFSLSRVSTTGDPGKCILVAKDVTKAAYEKALKRVKKPSAKAALKEYYVAGVSAIQGVQPQYDERVISYDKRQGDNRIRLDEMWTRFDLEN